MERLYFDVLPKWVLAVAVMALGVLVYGYSGAGSSIDNVWMAENPWSLNPKVRAPWTYSSPLGPVLAWTFGQSEWRDMQRFHFVLSVGTVVTCTYMMGRYVSDFAGRLFPIAFFCSPNSWASISLLGLFDVLTVGAITGMFVGGSVAALCAGLIGGVSHFEQAAVAAGAVSILRIGVLRNPVRPVVMMWVGLVIGKAFVFAYVSHIGVSNSARLDFARQVGIVNLIDGWRGNIPTYLWAVFNVLWVGVIWMARQMEREQRSLLVLSFLVVTIPVLLTLDIGRVYRTVSWPIVVLLIVFAAQHADRAVVRRWSLVLFAAAVFVPRTEIWYHGELPWIM